MKKVTLKDIANELGVTIGTVSHVLNGIDDISEDTKKKVLEAAKKMGYVSNSSAVSLRIGKSKSIAVIVPDVSNPHIAYQVKLIEEQLRPLGYSLIILNTNEDDKEEYNAILTACGKQVDGILLCPSQHNTDNLKFLDKIEIPYVLIGRYFENYDCDYVASDDIKGGYTAGSFLIDSGYKKPLYIGAYKYILGSRQRFYGVKKAFSENNIVLDDNDFFEICPTAQNIDEAIKYIDENLSKYDSIIAFSDLIAFKIISHLKKTEKNICVVGFDAINQHLCVPFAHTSVGMVAEGWAASATCTLLDKINGTKKSCKKLIDVKIFSYL